MLRVCLPEHQVVDTGGLSQVSSLPREELVGFVVVLSLQDLTLVHTGSWERILSLPAWVGRELLRLDLAWNTTRRDLLEEVSRRILEIKRGLDGSLGAHEVGGQELP